MTHDMAPVLVSTDESGNPTTTSLVIADGTENEHRAVLQLIRAHLADFEEFGRVAFQMRPFKTAGGTQRREVAVLNEEHATLLITYMRNTDVVRRFKKSLVRAFFELRQRAVVAQPALPDRRALAVMVLEAEDRADREAAARLEAEQQAAALAAPASAWTHMAAAAGDYAVSDAAKILSRDPNISIGRDRLFAFMAAEGWVYRSGRRNSWTAYQTQVDCGRLVEKMGKPFLNERTGENELPAPTIRITSKGLAELHKRLGGTAVLATMAVSA